MLYFAYGANLNLAGMRRRCPNAVPRVPAQLHGYRLTFRRVADIVPHAPGVVLGALYDITPACERALDVFEGVPREYRKSIVQVETDNGTLEAMAYIMNPAPFAPPEIGYFGIISRGYRDWGLDASALRRARLAALHEKNPV
jgi:gamma-glutamylcyclotransferase